MIFLVLLVAIIKETFWREFIEYHLMILLYDLIISLWQSLNNIDLSDGIITKKLIAFNDYL